MSDLIDRKAILKKIENIRQGVQMMDDTRRASIIMNGMHLCEEAVRNQPSADTDLSDYSDRLWKNAYERGKAEGARIPSAEPERKNVIEIPETGIGDLSDGYHTFNGLYEQRMILFAALVKAYKDRAWKSYRHEDGEWYFGGGWFIVGIDTPEGSYTYHYENKYWDMFDCADLPRGKHWDGHTEADAETRLLSLEPERKKGKWMPFDNPWYKCSECGAVRENKSFMENFCPNCGADMRGGEDETAV